LEIGDWRLVPIPNPQSTIPNPQSPNYFLPKFECYRELKKLKIKNSFLILKSIKLLSIKIKIEN